MATITIRNVPDELVDRIKLLAGQKGVSMEQEVRDLLQSRYEQRGAVLERMRQRWETLPLQSAEPMQDWKTQGDPMVIDTMVFAYALLRVEDKHEQAAAVLEGAGQIIVPDSLFAELGNVVWQWIQFRQLPLQIGLEVLADTEALVDKVVPSAWIRAMALELAVQAEHSFYDTLFVAAALQEKTQLVTFDRKLAAKFSAQVRLLG